MLDLSGRRARDLPHWKFSEMGGCYGAPGPGPVVAAMLGGSPVMGGTRTGRPWPSLDMAHPPPAHQASAHLTTTADGLARYGVYSLLPSDVYAAPRYVPAPAYHGIIPPAHKECVLTYPATGPGSNVYSAPVVERGISQLQELMAKGLDKKPRAAEPPPARPKRRSWEDDPGCNCREKTPAASPGCSRTTPVTLRPAPQVKREAATPALGHTPCQVAEVTTSAVRVKQEVVDAPTPAPATTPATSVPQVTNNTNTSSSNNNSNNSSSNNNSGIPVGIAVARQRSQAQEVRVKEDAVVPPLAVLACERPTNQTPLWAPPPAPGHALPFAPPPAFWHATPIEQNVPLQPPMGYQLARDPVSGQLLLISTGANISDSLQRAIVWPNNMSSFPSSPLLLPQAQPMGHLLLDRLVTLATPPPPQPPPPPHDKRRAPATPHPLLKIEEPSITGVMPCSKSSVVIQQLSAHSGPAPLLNPQFSAIASSGTHSVLIQHISGAGPVPHPSAPAPSVLITEAQGLLGGHQGIAGGQPQVLISHGQQDQSPVINPHVIGQLSSDLLTPHHAPPLPLVITAPAPAPHIHDNTAEIHVQIKESPKSEVEDVQETAETQLDEKIEPVNCCRSQATSPVPCLSPAVDSQQSQSEDEAPPPAPPQQADASNQTDSLPPSSDEEVEGEPVTVVETAPAQTCDAGPGDKSETAPVDLSGLELLSAASMEQIERSHSAPLAEPPRIKMEVEDPDDVLAAPPPPDVVIKRETDTEAPPVKVEECGAGLMGGLGLLCDVVHRVIEEEEAASRPHSPHEDDGDGDGDRSTNGWAEDAAYRRSRSRSRSQPRHRPDSPLDPAELDMRERLAQLQRLYREKQRELSRLMPRKSSGENSSHSSKRGPGRPKKSSSGTKRARSPSPAASPPPQLSPPMLEPWNLAPPTLTPHKASLRETDVQQVEWELVSPSKSPPPLSPAQSPSSASKKRKVGRPKKREDHGSLTIVAKKPRSKSSLVGLLLAKKHLPDAEAQHPHKIKPKLKAEVKVKSWCEEEEAEWTAQPPASPPPPTPGRPVKSKSLPTPGRPPHKKPIVVLAKRKRAVSTEQSGQQPQPQPQPLQAQGVVSCQLTPEHLAPGCLPSRVLVTMGGLLYAGTLSAIRPPDLYGTMLDGERGSRPHILSREEILKDAILEVCVTSAPPPGTRVCAYWSQQYRCLYPGTVPPPGPDDTDPRFVCVEFDDGDNGRICLDDIRLLPQDYPVVAYDPNPLQTLGKRRRRNSGASCDSQTKDKPVQPMETVMEPEVENDQEMEQETTPEVEQTTQQAVMDQVVPEEQHKEEQGKVVAEEQPTAVLTENITLSLEAAERERERRRLKKKRKEKLRRLDSEKKHRHKHRDCLKSHRHKHKHRHHRHRHRHGKSTPAPADTVVEEKKPLTLVVHTKPPPPTGGDTHSPPIVSRIKIKKDKKRGKSHVAEVQDSATPRSKMAAFLPARQLWGWSGRPYKRPGGRGRARKEFYKTIQRGKETISVGDCAVFLSTGRPDRPYIGRIEAMWENRFQTMVVKVRWFYHPEETVGCPEKLPYPGALFESPHNDENDVQTISHKCEVLPLPEYRHRLALEPHRLATTYDYNDVYYLAGYYNPTDLSLRFEPGVQ